MTGLLLEVKQMICCEEFHNSLRQQVHHCNLSNATTYTDIMKPLENQVFTAVTGQQTDR